MTIRTSKFILILSIIFPITLIALQKKEEPIALPENQYWCENGNITKDFKIFKSTKEECKAKSGTLLSQKKIEDIFRSAKFMSYSHPVESRKVLKELLKVQSDDWKIYQLLVDLKDDDYSIYEKYADSLLARANITTWYNEMQANKYYRKASELNKNIPSVNVKLAKILCKSGKYKEAEQYFRKGLSLNNNDAYINFSVAEFLFETGKLFQDYAKVQEAKILFNKALKLAKDDVKILSGYADILQKNGDFETSKDYYGKALTIKPNDPVLNYQYAKVLESGREKDKGPEYYYNKAIKLDNKDAKAHYYYANYLSNINAEKASIQYYLALHNNIKMFWAHQRFRIDVQIFIEKNPEFYNKEYKSFTFILFDEQFKKIPYENEEIQKKIVFLNNLKSFMEGGSLDIQYCDIFSFIDKDQMNNWRGKVAGWPYVFVTESYFKGFREIPLPLHVEIINSNDLLYIMFCSRLSDQSGLNSHWNFNMSNINHLKWLKMSKEDLHNPYGLTNLAKDSLILFYQMDFQSSFFNDSFLLKAFFLNSRLDNCKFDNSLLWRADFRDSILINASLKKAQLIGTNLTGTDLYNANMDECIFEVEKEKFPIISRFAYAKNLDKMRYKEYPDSLVNLRKAFEDAGYNYQAKQITCSIKTTERIKKTSSGYFWKKIEGYIYYIFIELPCRYGSAPSRALLIIIYIFGISCVIYFIFLRHQYKKKKLKDGIWKVWSSERIRQDLGEEEPLLVQVKGIRLFLFALYFSLLSAFNIGWREINIGYWINRIQRQEYTLKATGWVRTIAGIQSLLSVYLLGLFVLCYFGDPFKW